MSDLIYTNGNGQRMFLNNAGSRALALHVELPHIRFKFVHGHVPTINSIVTSEYEFVLISEDVTGDIYDLISTEYLFGHERDEPPIIYFFNNITKMNLLEIIDIAFNAIPSDQNNVMNMCADCTSLTAVCNFDCTKLKYIDSMFYNCRSLTAVPTFTNTTNLESCSFAFAECVNVTSGALALYNQLSQTITPDWAYTQTFYKCGSNTVQGAAELAQIPADWK